MQYLKYVHSKAAVVCLSVIALAVPSGNGWDLQARMPGRGLFARP